MPTIHLSLKINAPRERCFDLSRSIDLHQDSIAGTGEKAVAGITTGLISLSETVTWRAKHLGIWQNLTSEISDFHYPDTFTDRQVKGAFKRFDHQHIFIEENGGTLMKDIFHFQSSFGILGKLANVLFLTAYMRKFLMIRNNHIKYVAEGGHWKKYLSTPSL